MKLIWFVDRGDVGCEREVRDDFEVGGINIGKNGGVLFRDVKM